MIMLGSTSLLTDSSEFESHLLCNWRSVGRSSVSQSVLALSRCGTHNQIFVIVKTVAVLFVVGRLPHGRTVLSYGVIKMM